MSLREMIEKWKKEWKCPKCFSTMRFVEAREVPSIFEETRDIVLIYECPVCLHIVRDHHILYGGEKNIPESRV
jgi:NAD-dependent SIR2 family protein deacetylase